MQKCQINNHRFLSRKLNNNQSAKSLDYQKKLKSSKTWQDKKKIPQLIHQIQQSIGLLKKYYLQENAQGNICQIKPIVKKCSHPSKSINKNKNEQNVRQQHLAQQTISMVEIDDLKKSFLHVNGYDTNNIIQLYNYYRKNMEKSTRLFGSTSMSGVINLTQNHSQIRDKQSKTNYANAAETHEESLKQLSQVKINNGQLKFPQIKDTSVLNTKFGQLVNVGLLLADSKKSKISICQGMNSQNLLIQAKKKLFRNSVQHNIQRFQRMKQNHKNHNIRISPGKKKHSKQKQKSSQKVKIIMKANVDVSLPKNINNTVQQKHGTINIDEDDAQIKKVEQKKEYKQLQVNKQQKQNLQQKSAKSSRSRNSMRSPNSIKSLALNQAIILDLASDCESSSKKLPPNCYYISKTHNNNFQDSLLGCEITPKSQSKFLELQSIPFDF